MLFFQFEEETKLHIAGASEGGWKTPQGAGGPAVPEVSSEDSFSKSKNAFTGPLTSIFHLPISCDRQSAGIG